MFPYSTFLGPVFWMAMGAFVVIFFMGLAALLKDRQIPMNWWKWLLVVTWCIMLYIVVVGGFTLFGENETRAGLYFLGVFGTFMAVVGVALYRLLTK
ncbi:MAG: hypothetical protein K0B09_09425 [Bacteroidales bacterium]|nr:hypothetical protein [Bacteroidales bacterium]